MIVGMRDVEKLHFLSIANSRANELFFIITITATATEEGFNTFFIFDLLGRIH